MLQLLEKVAAFLKYPFAKSALDIDLLKSVLIKYTEQKFKRVRLVKIVGRNVKND